MRAAVLIAELGGGTLIDGLVDEHPAADIPQIVDLRFFKDSPNSRCPNRTSESYANPYLIGFSTS